ncbi:MAG TPA: hypothetical protein PKD61_03675, partial [Polyangiaceae bacterium]|nr:hypothetical protein [Polyangiaceae bacterium]
VFATAVGSAGATGALPGADERALGCALATLACAADRGGAASGTGPALDAGAQALPSKSMQASAFPRISPGG